MRQILVFLSGLLFSSGLIVSGMINPAKVLGFLDVFGQWDPSLVFVMGGGVVVTFIGYRFVLEKPKPIYNAQFSVPTRTDIDRHLLGGAALFGIGWGLIGLCPGPALVALVLKPLDVGVFMLAMLAGMYIPRLILAKSPNYQK